MTLIFAIACWFHPAPGYPPSNLFLQSQTRPNRVHSVGQLRRPPGG